MPSTPECLTEGELRAHLDGMPPDRSRPDVEEHLRACARCRERLSRMRDDAALAEAAFSASAPPVPDVAQAWQRFRARATGDAADPPLRRVLDMTTHAYCRLRRPLLGLASAAVVLAALILVPPLRTAAGQFLDIFRVRRIEVVTFDPDRAVGLDERLFTRVVMEEPQPQAVSGVEEAGRLTGRPVLSAGQVPPGFALTEFTVIPQRSARAWVDIEAARALLEMAGLPTDVLPEDPDANIISASIPPMSDQRYSDGTSSFAVLQVASPEVSVPQGMDAERVAELGLQLLGFSAEEARGLAQSIDWATTLVVPVPRDVASVQEVTVQGVKGYVLENRENEEYTETAVVWEKDDTVHVVAGDLPAEQLLAVAQSLR
ncbi:MAG: DUF4367 domain-containing protein [Anaerolineae bacterium]|nr:DUF4367 domain-containing protein [Anaerolineae bacterium]